MDEGLENPFKQSRASIPTASSLLTYGQESFSFFTRLQSSARTIRSHTLSLTQREVQESIISKIQKEIYTIDESGHCLAQSFLDDMITQDGDKQQDFWQKIRALKPKKQIQNPFASYSQNVIATRKPELPQKTVLSKIRRAQQHANPKSSRHLARKQLVKMKQVIRKESLKQGKDVGKVQKFSLASMYKNKRSELNSPSVVNLLQVKTETQIVKPQYPRLIIVRDAIYQRVDLEY